MTDKEKQAWDLLGKSEAPQVDEGFNQAVWEQLKDEATSARTPLRLPFVIGAWVAAAAAVIFCIRIAFWGPRPSDGQETPLSQEDRAIVAHLELLENMDTLEHVSLDGNDEDQQLLLLLADMAGDDR